MNFSKPVSFYKTMRNHRFFVPALVVTAVLAWIGMCMSTPVVMSVAFHNTGTDEAPIEMNAPYMRLVNTPQQATITLYYRGYGNTQMRVFPNGCLVDGYKVNGVHYAFPGGVTKWCGDLNIDMQNDIHPGENTVSVNIIIRDAPNTYSPTIGLNVGPSIFGKDAAQSSFMALFFACLFALGGIFLRYRGFDPIASGIFLFACLLYVQEWHHLGDFSNSQDIPKHLSYLQYISEHFFHPYGYVGPEFWHPPLYYWMEAIILKITQFFGVWSPSNAIEASSIACYIVLVYFSMRTLARWFSGYAYYLASALMALWPAGFISVAWFYNDVPLYPLYAMCFYYGVVWYEEGRPSSLRNAILCGALGLMFKTSGAVPLAIIGACVLFKLATRQCQWRSLLNKQSCTGIAGLIFAGIFLCGRLIYTYAFLGKTLPSRHLLGQMGGYTVTPQALLYLDIHDLLANPYLQAWTEPFMWNEFIKTLMFNESHWSFAAAASCMNALFLVMLVYMLVFIFTLSRAAWLRYFPVLAAFFIPAFAVVAFIILCHNIACMDFRYVRPALLAIVAVFMLSLEQLKDKRWPALYYLGNAVALLMIAVSVISFEQMVL